MSSTLKQFGWIAGLISMLWANLALSRQIDTSAFDFYAASCQKNQQLKAKYVAALDDAKEVYKINRIMQASKLKVGDINAGENCSSQWVARVLGLGELQLGAAPVCGVIIQSSLPSAKTIAKVAQVLFPLGGSVMKLNGLTIPFCVMVKAGS